MKKLTARQQVVYDFITEYYTEKEIPPTVREIADGLGFKSPNSVQEHLRLIEKKGFVKLRRGIARGIFPLTPEVADEPEIIDHSTANIRQLPVIGNVAAGTPILALENRESEIAVDANMFSGRDLFALRVKGDSMIEDGIKSGDVVIVRQQNTAQNGDRVVAMIDGDTTLKTYLHKTDHVILHPENKNYADIVVDEHSNFSIAGKMVGLYRQC